MIGPQFAGYSDIQPIPERPEAVDLGPEALHPWTTLVANDGEWTLRRTWQGRWYACHPLHGRFYMDPCGNVADQRRAFRAFVRNGGALPALR